MAQMMLGRMFCSVVQSVKNFSISYKALRVEKRRGKYVNEKRKGAVNAGLNDAIKRNGMKIFGHLFEALNFNERRGFGRNI